jgi:hypothetical protein
MVGHDTHDHGNVFIDVYSACNLIYALVVMITLIITMVKNKCKFNPIFKLSFSIYFMVFTLNSAGAILLFIEKNI